MSKIVKVKKHYDKRLIFDNEMQEKLVRSGAMNISFYFDDETILEFYTTISDFPNYQDVYLISAEYKTDTQIDLLLKFQLVKKYLLENEKIKSILWFNGEIVD